MPTEWFITDGSGIAPHAEDPNLAIIGDYTPDWVKIPEPLENAGTPLRVVSHHVATCPKCKEREVRHLMLESRYGVAECKPGCGFVFYRLSVNTKESE